MLVINLLSINKICLSNFTFNRFLYSTVGRDNKNIYLLLLRYQTYMRSMYDYGHLTQSKDSPKNWLTDVRPITVTVLKQYILKVRVYCTVYSTLVSYSITVRTMYIQYRQYCQYGQGLLRVKSLYWVYS